MDKGGRVMTREEVFIEILNKLNGLEKEELLMIGRVTESCCIHQSMKKAIYENNVQQLQTLIAG